MIYSLSVTSDDCIVSLLTVRQRPVTLPFVQKHLAPLTEIADWSESFLCRPHPDLGRKGPVCAFAKKAWEKDLFWLTVCAAEQPTCDEVCTLVLRYQQWYREVAPHEDEEDAQYKTLLILFPYLRDAIALPLLTTVHKLLEHDFTAKNLLLGHFYPNNEQPGLWSTTFRPMAAPVPLLAMRHIVQMDHINAATMHRVLLGMMDKR